MAISVISFLAKGSPPVKLTFNNVSPGTIKSRMQKDIKKTKFIKMIKDIPSKKIGQPEDVANLIAFLINKQSNYINGSIINLNGGSYLD